MFKSMAYMLVVALILRWLICTPHISERVKERIKLGMCIFCVVTLIMGIIVVGYLEISFFTNM